MVENQEAGINHERNNRTGVISSPRFEAVFVGGKLNTSWLRRFAKFSSGHDDQDSTHSSDSDNARQNQR